MNQYGFYVCVSKMFIGLSIVLLRRNPVLGLYNKEEYVSYLNQLLYSYGVVTYV